MFVPAHASICLVYQTDDVKNPPKTPTFSREQAVLQSFHTIIINRNEYNWIEMRNFSPRHATWYAYQWSTAEFYECSDSPLNFWKIVDFLFVRSFPNSCVFALSISVEMINFLMNFDSWDDSCLCRLLSWLICRWQK